MKSSSTKWEGKSWLVWTGVIITSSSPLLSLQECSILSAHDFTAFTHVYNSNKTQHPSHFFFPKLMPSVCHTSMVAPLIKSAQLRRFHKTTNGWPVSKIQSGKPNINDFWLLLPVIFRCHYSKKEATISIIVPQHVAKKYDNQNADHS